MRKDVVVAVLFSMFGSSLAIAGTAMSVKTCSTVLSMPGDSKLVPTKFEIFKNKNSASAKVTQTVEGYSSSYDDVAEIADYAVRAGLSADGKAADLNQAEQLIIGTMGFLQAPEIGSFFSVGLDLKAIRSVRAYTIGKATHMGSTVIIEARDANGEDIGSFLTGFFPYACEK